MEYFLKKSNSYNYYKKESESVAQLKEDFKEYKKTTDDYLDSYNHLFNTLFLDYELHPKPLLSGLQGICVELLSFCDNVCKKYDLEWWIDFGNLIGTVRHGGFVPWDDDTDIGMMRQDYIKFNEVLPKEIEKYNLQDIITISALKNSTSFVLYSGIAAKPPILVIVLTNNHNPITKYNSIRAVFRII